VIHWCPHYRSYFPSVIDQMPLYVLEHIKGCVIPMRRATDGRILEAGNSHLRIDVSRMWRRQKDAIEPAIGTSH
jgi:hypothetical protein